LMLCSVVVGYQHFGGPCCLHFQGEEMEMVRARSSKTLEPFYNTTQHQNPEDLNMKGTS